MQISNQSLNPSEMQSTDTSRTVVTHETCGRPSYTLINTEQPHNFVALHSMNHTKFNNDMTMVMNIECETVEPTFL